MSVYLLCVYVVYMQGPIISPCHANDRHIRIWACACVCVRAHFLCFISFKTIRGLYHRYNQPLSGWNLANCMFMFMFKLATYHCIAFHFRFLLPFYRSFITSGFQGQLVSMKRMRFHQHNGTTNHACCIIHICICLFFKASQFLSYIHLFCGRHSTFIFDKHWSKKKLSFTADF